MLNELKEELEYCRRKWALAREKNNESQIQWNSLRLEFSNRKLLDESNSAESGFSDDLLSDDEATAEVKKQEQLNESVPNHEETGSCDVGITSLTEVYQRPIEIDVTEQESSSPVLTEALTVYQTPIEIDVTDVPLATIQLEPISKLEYTAASHFEPTLPVKKSVNIKQNIIVGVAGTSASTSTQEDKSKVLSAFMRKESKKNKTKKKKKSEKSQEESLEQMFYRISGQAPEECEESESEEEEEEEEEEVIEHISEGFIDLGINSECAASSQPDEEIPIDLSNTVPLIPTPTASLINTLGLEDDERRERRAERFKRLEEQCQQLITQVVNTSSRGDKLNMQLDEVHRRYKPVESNPSCNDPETNEACTSGSVVNSDIQDNDSLTQREQEYTSRRAERLKRLETECKAFLDKVNNSHSRAVDMNTKLEVLHNRYEKKNGPCNKTNNEASTSQVEVKDESSSSVPCDLQLVESGALSEVSISQKEIVAEDAVNSSDPLNSPLVESGTLSEVSTSRKEIVAEDVNSSDPLNLPLEESRESPEDSTSQVEVVAVDDSCSASLSLPLAKNESCNGDNKGKSSDDKDGEFSTDSMKALHDRGENTAVNEDNQNSEDDKDDTQ